MSTQSTATERQNASRTSAKPEGTITEIRRATGLETILLMSKRRVASNLLLDPLYQLRKTKEILWADPVIIYLPPGEQFGNVVLMSENVMFLVPTEFNGLVNVVLALPSMSFKATQMKNGPLILEVRNGKKIMAIENFPIEDGWYLPDPKTGIPQGEKVSRDNPYARYLWRKSRLQHISPVVRVCGGYGGGRGVSADWGLGGVCGVALLSRAKPECKPAAKKPSPSQANLARQMEALLREVSEAEKANSEMARQLRALRKIARIAGKMKADLG